MSFTAYYGDNTTPRLFVIDPVTMTRVVAGDIKLNSTAYPVDKATQNGSILYAITRGVKSVTPVDTKTYKAGKPLPLLHKPRSTSTANGKCLIAGADEPVTSVVDVKNSKVEQIVGQPTPVTDMDYGGGLASGHPFWLSDKKRFLLLDRRRRKISAYRLGENLPFWEVRTPTSAHHIERIPGQSKVFVALCEGNQEAMIPPAVMVIRESKAGLSVEKLGFVSAADPSVLGAHHLSFSPDGSLIYVPSTEGAIHVLTTATLKPKGKPIKAGKGAGHVFFSPNKKSNIGICINHTDTFVTLFDWQKQKVLADIQVVSALPAPKKKSQAHTSSFDTSGKYFYSAASQDGEFYRIDIAKKKKDKTLDLNTHGMKAEPLQGVFVS